MNILTGENNIMRRKQGQFLITYCLCFCDVFCVAAWAVVDVVYYGVCVMVAIWNRIMPCFKSQKSKKFSTNSCFCLIQSSFWIWVTSLCCCRLYSGVEGRAAMGALKLPTVSLLHTALHDQCPLRGDQAPACPDSSGRYRTADGRCNNPAHPWWGAAMMPLHRFLPSHYRDGRYWARRLFLRVWV